MYVCQFVCLYLSFLDDCINHFVKAVTEHRSRLERQTRRDNELISKLKKGIRAIISGVPICISSLCAIAEESTLRESDLETQLVEHKEESSRKYGILSSAHSSLQVCLTHGWSPVCILLDI